MSRRTLASHRFAADVLAVPELRLLMVEAVKFRAIGELVRTANASVLVPGQPRLEKLIRNALYQATEVDGDQVDFGDVGADLVGEMTYARMLDSFQAYLVEILTEVVRRHPALLGLDGENPEAAAERRIDHLSRGTGRLMDFLTEAFGAGIFADDEQRQRLDLYVDVRNLLVHHRGRVHDRFANRWGLDADRVGALYELPDEFVKQASRDLLQVGSNIDEIAITRFGVPPAVDDTD